MKHYSNLTPHSQEYRGRHRGVQFLDSSRVRGSDLDNERIGLFITLFMVFSAG